jgi:hypothetical protein
MTSPLFQDEVETWQNEHGVTVIRRDIFARNYFDYDAGEHVVFGGPSTRGKTSLAFDLMEVVATPEFPAYVAVSKPSDPVTAKRGAELGFRRVSEWPPPTKLNELSLFGGKKPPGYIIWPPFGDLNVDMKRCADLTRKLLMERYSAGANTAKNKGGILVMDDTMVKAKIMGLDREMVTILAMAGAMKFGLWAFVQKPTDSGRTTTWSYEMASHLFFTKGGDSRMMQRYVEIIGEKGPIAKQIIPTLKEFEFLYVHKVTGAMCVVGAK